MGEVRRWARRPVTRRDLLRGTGAVALGATLSPLAMERIRAAAAQATPTRNIAGTELKLLQWSHFVPRYDAWFDAFAKAWGDANGVAVTVDHINTADVPAAIAAEISAGEGHDLIEHIVPAAQYGPSMLDLRDVVDEATKRHGPQADVARLNSYNPTTDTFFAFCHGYAPDPANYRKDLWTEAGLPDGPKTYDELRTGGKQIRDATGIQLGIGMSNEVDSNMAAQAMMWAFGGSVQDENENVVINSPENIAAVEYMAGLFTDAMTPEVFGWNAASNNQLMIAGRASYILNSISAYRTAQKDQPETAAGIYFGSPLVGPGGPERALAHGHAVFNYMVPNHSQYQDTAKEFLLYLTSAYDQATSESELYNFPAFPSTVPNLVEEGGPLDVDPFGSDPVDKLAVLKTAESWTRNLGWPGPANAAIGEVFGTFVLPTMMARVARGEQTAQESIAQAESETTAIFDRWRAEGLIGGGQ